MNKAPTCCLGHVGAQCIKNVWGIQPMGHAQHARQAASRQPSQAPPTVGAAQESRHLLQPALGKGLLQHHRLLQLHTYRRRTRCASSLQACRGLRDLSTGAGLWTMAAISGTISAQAAVAQLAISTRQVHQAVCSFNSPACACGLHWYRCPPRPQTGHAAPATAG